jgi:hypothetical protein
MSTNDPLLIVTVYVARSSRDDVGVMVTELLATAIADKDVTGIKRVVVVVNSYVVERMPANGLDAPSRRHPWVIVTEYLMPPGSRLVLVLIVTVRPEMLI